MADLFSKISFRLPAIVILATALASLAVGGVSYFNSADEVRRQESDKLVSLGVSRHSALTQYFRSIEEDLELLASNSQVAAALGDFRRAFGQIDRADRARQEQAFHQIFSPQTTDGDGALVRQFNSAVFSDYFHAHNRHHDWFRMTHELRGITTSSWFRPRATSSIRFSRSRISPPTCSRVRGPIRASRASSRGRFEIASPSRISHPTRRATVPPPPSSPGRSRRGIASSARSRCRYRSGGSTTSCK